MVKELCLAIVDSERGYPGSRQQVAELTAVKTFYPDQLQRLGKLVV